MITYLIYSSDRSPDCSQAEIDQILIDCQHNNKALGITGVLLITEDQFLQYMEGSEESVTQLLNKIKLDSRHKSLKILSEGTLPERVFPTWQMGSRRIDKKDLNLRFNTTLKEETLGNEIKPEVDDDTLQFIFRLYGISQ